MGDRPHWVHAQKTFTKWAIVQLNGAHTINDVEKDMDDGFVLIALLEALWKQKVNFKNKNPKMRVARLENTNRHSSSSLRTVSSWSTSCAEHRRRWSEADPWSSLHADSEEPDFAEGGRTEERTARAGQLEGF